MSSPREYQQMNSPVQQTIICYSSNGGAKSSQSEIQQEPTSSKLIKIDDDYDQNSSSPNGSKLMETIPEQVHQGGDTTSTDSTTDKKPTGRQ